MEMVEYFGKCFALTNLLDRFMDLVYKNVSEEVPNTLHVFVMTNFAWNGQLLF